MRGRVYPLLILFSATTLLSTGPLGCSKRSKKVDVTGKVTYNGGVLEKPNGTIIFVGPDGNQALAAINFDGTYIAIGVTRGQNKVVVYYTAPQKPDARNPVHRRLPMEEPDPKEQWATDTSPFLTPVKYTVVETSELAVLVEKDTVYNPDLTGPPIK